MTLHVSSPEVSPPVGISEPGVLTPSVADTIYRRYFTAGILVVLTVGAGWGLWLLWQIGITRSFTGVSIHHVNAHGHAQIFGWVGLFIMGFGYQVLPRFWHSPLIMPRLAAAAFLLMLVGIAARTAGMWSPASAWGLPLAMTGGGLELAAITAFVGQMVATYRRSEQPFEPYILFVLTAMAFFPVQAGFGLWHTWNTMTAGSREQLLWYVGTYQAVLRDLQIHGLALFMILGVSLRLLPAMFGLPRISPRRAMWAWGMLLAAVVGESAVFVAFRWTGQYVWAAMLLLPWLLLAAGSLLIPWRWKLWRVASGDEIARDRSGKFIRAAYGWLAISMAMLLLLPVYQLVSGTPFSHAYYGAIRHAVTVGFISLMIMGVAAKVVPTLTGHDPRSLTRLWGPFVLVNVGCLLRVCLQTLTDWHPAFFGLVGFSGVLELAGLTWWGVGLLGLMRAGKRRALAPSVASSRPASIRAEHRVAEVLGWFPQSGEAFDRLGLAPLRNPLLRRALASRTTLAQAAAMRGVPLEKMLETLNASAGLEAARPRQVPHAGMTIEQALRLGLVPQEQLTPLMENGRLDRQASLAEAASALGCNWGEWLVQLVAAQPRPACGSCCDTCSVGAACDAHPISA